MSRQTFPAEASNQRLQGYSFAGIPGNVVLALAPVAR